MTLKNNRAPLATLSFMHHFVACVNSNWSYSPETAKLDFDHCDLDLWPLTLTFGMGITSVIGNHSWKFHDDTMMGAYWKMCDRRSEGRTDRSVLRAAWLQLKIRNSNVIVVTWEKFSSVAKPDHVVILTNTSADSDENISVSVFQCHCGWRG